jgi:hypothetical protein
MSAVSVDLDAATVRTLKSRGLEERGMAQAVRDAIWFTYGDDPSVEIDLEIAAEFERTRIGVSGEDAIAWLESLDTSAPLPRPKSRFLAPNQS